MMAQLQVKFIGLLGSLILRLIVWTLRVEKYGFHEENEYWVEGSPRIITLWHGRQLLAPWVVRGHFRNGKKKEYLRTY